LSKKAEGTPINTTAVMIRTMATTTWELGPYRRQQYLNNYLLTAIPNLQRVVRVDQRDNSLVAVNSIVKHTLLIGIPSVVHSPIEGGREGVGVSTGRTKSNFCVSLPWVALIRRTRRPYAYSKNESLLDPSSHFVYSSSKWSPHISLT
jgi:hypothetical protein